RDCACRRGAQTGAPARSHEAHPQGARAAGAPRRTRRTRVKPTPPKKKQALTVGRLIERMHDVLQLEHVPTTGGLGREIASPHVSSPGLALAGYTERFAPHRLQVLGETEVTYLSSLGEEQRPRILKEFFKFKVPCFFLTKGIQPPAGLVEEATFADVAVLLSKLKTNEFYN